MAKSVGAKSYGESDTSSSDDEGSSDGSGDGSSIGGVLERGRGRGGGRGDLSGCAWILKSVDMSRGRGITLSDDIHEILRRCAAKEYRLIVQRYVERPLLIQRRKFDIRQWVLVSSVNPLTVWMYSNYYLRFSSCEYTSGDLDNAEVHLTNQSVQKHSEDYGSSIDCNMWSKAQFVEHLCAESELGPAAGRAAAEHIEEQMSRAVGVALRATCDIIEHRKHSFELFGFDFLVDSAHGVWLLEANSSPDMSTNAAPLKQIVNDGLDDLLNVIFDLKRKRVPVSKLADERATRDLDADGPCWRLAYHGKAMSERELQKRRLTKKASPDAAAAASGASPRQHGMSHHSALRVWVDRLGASAS